MNMQPPDLPEETRTDYEIGLDEGRAEQATRIIELEAQLSDWKALHTAIATGQPIWPNNWAQEVAMLAYEFDLKNAQLEAAKQAARWESDLASQALADLEPYRKDAERYQWLCDKGYNYHGAMAGTGSMSICRGPYILFEPPSHNKFSNMVLGKPAADLVIDAAIAEGKA